MSRCSWEPGSLRRQFCWQAWTVLDAGGGALYNAPCTAHFGMRADKTSGVMPTLTMTTRTAKRSNNVKAMKPSATLFANPTRFNCVASIASAVVDANAPGCEGPAIARRCLFLLPLLLLVRYLGEHRATTICASATECHPFLGPLADMAVDAETVIVIQFLAVTDRAQRMDKDARVLML